MKFPPEAADRICARLPNADQATLIGWAEEILAEYSEQRELSRDEMATHSEIMKRLCRAHGHLASVFDEIAELDKGLTLSVLPGFLNERYGGDFIRDLGKAKEALRAFIEGAEDAPLSINNERHSRPTRTRTRDDFLIPALVAAASKLANLRPAEDWDDLDQVCAFVSATLAEAGIPAPDAGDTDMAGEEHQGRLRRQVKNAARGL